MEKLFYASVIVLMCWGMAVLLSSKVMHLYKVYKLENIWSCLDILLLIAIVIHFVMYQDSGGVVCMFCAAIIVHIVFQAAISNKYRKFVDYLVSCRYGAFLPTDCANKDNCSTGILKVGDFELVASFANSDVLCEDSWVWVAVYIDFGRLLRPKEIFAIRLPEEELEELAIGAQKESTTTKN